MRRLAAAVAGATVLASALLTAPPAAAYPPTPPGESTARANLAQLTVAPDGSMDGYDREKFPHWSPQDGNCNTRETVLVRDGTDVVVDNACEPTSGSWYSVYDGVWVGDDSDVHIDHVVPLAEAWRTGARDWSESRREAFANDLGSQQLIAVSGSSNTSKGDKAPEDWKPENTGYWCMYARSWINVKHTYDLTVSDAEVTALEEMLDAC
ncbi:hypothetical protein SZMC14600_03556 [Saccharomonospora azurea SZMC 14600]|uniref:HNH endonuclease family protein n=1 Tax=Saccharomonospora azurea TaxID=40988 RepID=UPI00024000DD|nr:HNH endonuclease family protein [Saccharomonospora azurea]EHK88749.1 hypothetical protein SZMC14600_03556 [Saccharomonospora azurea SZMC 14600]